MNPVERRAVAFYLPGLQGGGAERIVLNLTAGIAERGIPVDLVLAAATGPLLHQTAPGVRLVDLGSPRVLRSIRPLASYLRRERPRVLVSSWIGIFAQGRALSWRYRRGWFFFTVKT